MKQFEPNYYKEFSCIADKCRHSCCIGWEIDIDESTLEKYEKQAGKIGEKLRKNLVIEDGVSHFCLDENKRCPFLNENNLCEIILELGESNISQICTDHPRFYNEFSERVEVGIGICCDEAARIILSNEKTFLVQTEGGTETEEEEEFFEWRTKLFEFVQNRNVPFDTRLRILYDVGITDEIISLYKSLECLDENWHEKLNDISDNYDFYGFEIPFEQLLMYFIYRHTPDALYDGRYEERVAFSVLSVLIIRAVFEKCEEQTMENLIEISRMYSSEIEYSEENTEKILEKLTCIL
ncbi:MAG: flagellin lysine-N-methylase [Clostridia bacterium]|nr:flagellin lysine-N-methylase [Clostridia bacterium]